MLISREDLLKAQKVVFFLADQTPFFLPMIGPFVPIIEKLILAAEENFLEPQPLSAEELNAIGAGMAAHDASVLTSFRMKEGKK